MSSAVRVGVAVLGLVTAIVAAAAAIIGFDLVKWDDENPAAITSGGSLMPVPAPPAPASPNR